MNTLTKFLLGCSLVSILFSAPLSADEDRVYTVGVVPQFDVRQIHATWRPILDEIEKKTGLKFKLRGSATIPAFEREFLVGKFDFAYMNPHQAILAQGRQPYIPMVKDVGEDLHGIIVVAKDSALESVEQLDGKVLAFPAPNALGATLLTRAELLNKHGINIIPRYVQTHSSVYLNVILGNVIAGGGVQKSLSQQPENVRNAVRVLHRTQSVPPHPFTAHPRVSVNVRQRVRDALLAMGETPEGRAKLANVPIHKIGLAFLKEYLPLADLELEHIE